MPQSKKWEVNYRNDLVFKYLCSRDDEDSAFIRNTIIERVTGIRPKESYVLNPEIDPDVIGIKSIILDVHVKDENGFEYDIEMQVGSAGRREVMRFEYYGARMLSDQLDIGENYEKLKTVFQIIFINMPEKHRGNLIAQYQMRTKYGDEENIDGLQKRTYIHLPQINQIAKQKGVLQMNDFEQLCYLFENNAKDDILKSDRKLVKIVMEKFNEMQNNDKLWSMAKAIEMGEFREINRVQDGYDEGRQDGLKEGVQMGLAEGRQIGLAEGKFDGKKGAVKLLLKNRYQMDDSAWLNELDDEQLDRVTQLIFTCASFEELKKHIDNDLCK